MENDTKCYKVTCYCTTEVDYYVYTDSKEAAEELVKRKQYTDKDIINETIEEIISCVEEDD